MGAHSIPDSLNQPTQTAYPWRATARTVFAVLIGVLSVIPTFMATSGLDSTVVGAQVVVVTGAVTKALAHPMVNALIARYAPWLAAEPR
ncbi:MULTISPECIES: hypothetical protein [Rhodococcus]|uniref:hypothetical protein n=1 Tax=Rhodococcus TaxID=1827 RepID=UPI000C7BA43D|nr:MULTISPECIES: hypothetical protein [Rhodococcus]AUM18215.1 hypothetical protein CSW53_17795 [Rhodococcus ruber]